MSPIRYVPVATGFGTGTCSARICLLFASSTVLAFALRFEGFEWGAGSEPRGAALPPDLPSAQARDLLARRHLPAALALRRHDRHRAPDLGVGGLRAGRVCCSAAWLLPVLGLTAMRVPLSVLFMDALLTAAFAALPRFAVRAFGRRGQRQPPGGRAPGAHRGGRRGGRDDRQGAARPPAARAQPDRLRGRRPLQARPPDVRSAGARAAWRRSRIWSERTRSTSSSSRCPGRRAPCPAGRAGGARGGRQDPHGAGDVRHHLRPGERGARSGRSRSRTCSGASRSRPTSSRCACWRPARRCWSPAPADRSAASSAASSPRLEPAQILLLGHGENSIFDVLAELTERFPHVTTRADHRRRARPGAAAAGLRAVPALLGVPRRRAQARAADGRATSPRR